MVTREELFKLYQIIENHEKILWATKAKYKTYHGLYRYLSKGTGPVYSRVVQAAIDVLGEERYKTLMESIRQSQEKNKKKDENVAKDIVLYTPVQKYMLLIEEIMRTGQLEELEQLLKIMPEMEKKVKDYVETLKYMKSFVGFKFMNEE